MEMRKAGRLPGTTDISDSLLPTESDLDQKKRY
jgi:hypothetical protein